MGWIKLLLTDGNESISLDSANSAGDVLILSTNEPVGVLKGNLSSLGHALYEPEPIWH